MRRGALVLLGVVLLTGCVSAFPAEKLVGVDRSITLGVLRSDPDRFRQARVLLAGEIIQTRPRPGNTEIEVISRPLGDGDAPRFTDTSDGRFLLTAPDFLDPAIYATGRRLSVVGTVTGSEERPVGDLPYRYVTVAIDQLYLWPRPVNAYPYPYYPYYYGGFGRPYWPYYW